MKKFLCVMIAFVMLVTLFAGCSKNDVNGDSNLVQESNSVIDATTEEVNKQYIYKAYGLQNVADVGSLVYNEEKNCYTSIFTTFYCPQCRNEVSEISANIKISSSDMGKEIVIWEGEACCTNTHNGDAFFNGWFDVSIQYVIVKE